MAATFARDYLAKMGLTPQGQLSKSSATKPVVIATNQHKTGGAGKPNAAATASKGGATAAVSPEVKAKRKAQGDDFLAQLRSPPFKEQLETCIRTLPKQEAQKYYHNLNFLYEFSTLPAEPNGPHDNAKLVLLAQKLRRDMKLLMLDPNGHMREVLDKILPTEDNERSRREYQGICLQLRQASDEVSYALSIDPNITQLRSTLAKFSALGGPNLANYQQTCPLPNQKPQPKSSGGSALSDMFSSSASASSSAVPTPRPSSSGTAGNGKSPMAMSLSAYLEDSIYSADSSEPPVLQDVLTNPLLFRSFLLFQMSRRQHFYLLFWRDLTRLILQRHDLLERKRSAEKSISKAPDTAGSKFAKDDSDLHSATDLDEFDSSELRELYYQFEGIGIKYQHTLDWVSQPPVSPTLQPQEATDPASPSHLELGPRSSTGSPASPPAPPPISLPGSSTSVPSTSLASVSSFITERDQEFSTVNSVSSEAPSPQSISRSESCDLSFAMINSLGAVPKDYVATRMWKRKIDNIRHSLDVSLKQTESVLLEDFERFLDSGADSAGNSGPNSGPLEPNNFDEYLKWRDELKARAAEITAFFYPASPSSEAAAASPKASALPSNQKQLAFVKNNPVIKNDELLSMACCSIADLEKVNNVAQDLCPTNRALQFVAVFTTMPSLDGAVTPLVDQTEDFLEVSTTSSRSNGASSREQQKAGVACVAQFLDENGPPSADAASFAPYCFPCTSSSELKAGDGDGCPKCTRFTAPRCGPVPTKTHAEATKAKDRDQWGFPLGENQTTDWRGYIRPFDGMHRIFNFSTSDREGVREYGAVLQLYEPLPNLPQTVPTQGPAFAKQGTVRGAPSAKLAPHNPNVDRFQTMPDSVAKQLLKQLQNGAMGASGGASTRSPQNTLSSFMSSGPAQPSRSVRSMFPGPSKTLESERTAEPDRLRTFTERPVLRSRRSSGDLGSLRDQDAGFRSTGQLPERSAVAPHRWHAICIKSSAPLIDVLRDALETLLPAYYHGLGLCLAANANCEADPLGAGSLYSVADTSIIIKHILSSPAFNQLKCLVRPAASIPLDLFSITKQPLYMPPLDLSYDELFRCLSPNDILTVIEHILAEKKVLVYSSNSASLSLCVEAILSLLYPFQLHHCCIPYLPLTMFEYLASPYPFFIGIHSCFLDQARRVMAAESNDAGSVIYINLDGQERAQARSPAPSSSTLPHSRRTPSISSLPLSTTSQAVGPSMPSTPGLASSTRSVDNSAVDDTPRFPEAVRTLMLKHMHHLYTTPPTLLGMSSVQRTNALRIEFVKMWAHLLCGYRYFAIFLGRLAPPLPVPIPVIPRVDPATSKRAADASPPLSVSPADAVENLRPADPLAPTSLSIAVQPPRPVSPVMTRSMSTPNMPETPTAQAERKRRNRLQNARANAQQDDDSVLIFDAPAFVSYKDEAEQPFLKRLCASSFFSPFLSERTHYATGLRAVSSDVFDRYEAVLSGTRIQLAPPAATSNAASAPSLGLLATGTLGPATIPDLSTVGALTNSLSFKAMCAIELAATQ